VNVWNPLGLEKSKIEIAVKSVNQAYTCTATFDATLSALTPGTDCLAFMEARSWRKGLTDHPPFFEFALDPAVNNMPTDAGTMFDVTVTPIVNLANQLVDPDIGDFISVKGAEVRGKSVTRRFRIDKSGEGALRKQDILICMNSDCSDSPYQPGRESREVVEKFNMSEIPTTRGG